MTTAHPATVTAVDRNHQRPYGLWWLSPPAAVLLVVPLTLALSWVVPASTFQAKWGAPKALTQDFIANLTVAGLVFVVASMLPLFAQRGPMPEGWPAFTDAQFDRIRRVALWLFRLTITGYVLLLGVGLSRGVRPLDLLRAITEQNTFGGELKDSFSPIAGVTSFTQMGIAYSVLGTLLILNRVDTASRRRLAIVLGLAAFRSYLLSERLALLELIIPIMVVLATHGVVRTGRSGRSFLRAAPLAFGPLVIMLFAVFEFSRSWVWYSQQAASTFWTFAVDRFGGYYTTAYNNGQLAFDYQRAPGRLPWGSIEGLWNAPGIEQIGLYDRLNSVAWPPLSEVLDVYGNPEFNNPCGLCAPLVDWGVSGGYVFLGAAGLLLGVAYVSYVGGNPVGILVYPPLVTGLFEMPRYLYWTAGRVLPTLAVLVAAGIWVSRASPEADLAAAHDA